jgi:hypothetical protein
MWFVDGKPWKIEELFNCIVPARERGKGRQM